MNDAPSQHDDDPRQLFRGLGFAFVHRFLWSLLAATSATLAAALALSWVIEADVTVRAEGALQPAARHVVKSRLDGRIRELPVLGGQSVRAGEILAVLDPRDLRAQLAQVEAQLHLSDLRRRRLAQQIDDETGVLGALLDARDLDVERATMALDQVRQEQALYSARLRPGWQRRALEDLVPVRLARLALGRARVDRDVTRRQLAATASRREELALEEQSWQQLDVQRRRLWARLEATVIRAPVDGVVLTEDLELRVGDSVSAGEALLELAEGDSWQVHVRFAEVDRPKLRVGQRARVFVAAYPHLEHGVLQGQVVHVAQQPAAGQGYPVDVALDEVGLAVADGMAAEVRVTVDDGRLLQLVWRRLLREVGRAPLPTWRRAQEES
jgi:membrane fusion protein (multidrug efflux system)